MDEEAKYDFPIGKEEEKKPKVFVFSTHESNILWNIDDDGNYYNNECTSFDLNATNDCISLCDWLADSAMTSHIMNLRDVLMNYQDAGDILVAGIGGMRTYVHGHGTIKLESECAGQRHILRLENVLYVPNKKNNLLLLGRWENDVGEHGKLTLMSASGVPIATGTKIKNSLYKMDVRLCKCVENDVPNGGTYTFASITRLNTWEAWHEHFGHIGYTSGKLFIYFLVLLALFLLATSKKSSL
jgi:hypothetical protein